MHAYQDKELNSLYRHIQRRFHQQRQGLFGHNRYKAVKYAPGRARILQLCNDYAQKALVVVDETYVEYADTESLIPCLDTHANLVILRTLSKSHAAAGLRCGVAVARSDVNELLQKVLAPYPLAQLR